jgi:hypothetical protein
MAEDLLSAERVLSLSPEEADRELDRLERGVPVRPGVVDLPGKGFREAVVIGDSHGDWRSTLAAVRLFLDANGGPRCFVGLGDYVDRPPNDCENGSVVNALLLLDLAARWPDRVFLLQGNHETVRRIPALPHSLPEEVDDLWGPEAERYSRILGLLERGPLAAASANGAYLAHAGFPLGDLPAAWRRIFEDVDETRLAEIVWSDPDATRNPHGFERPWGATELAGFLARGRSSVFLRGHNPDLMGRPLYGGRCLTLHTTRIYQRYGGVLAARLPLEAPLSSTVDIAVEHLSTERGRSDPRD